MKMKVRLDDITPQEVLDEDRAVPSVSQTSPHLLMLLGTLACTALTFALTRNLDITLLSTYCCFALSTLHAGRRVALSRKELIIGLLRLRISTTEASQQRRAVTSALDSILPIHRRELDLETKLFPGGILSLALIQAAILFQTPATPMLRGFSAVMVLVLYCLVFRIFQERMRFQKRIRRLRPGPEGIAA